MTTDILGVWKLRSYVMEAVETGERMEPFGAEPRGSLILHSEGRMIALITPGAGAEAGRIVAYAGRFRLEAPDRIVTAVDVSSVPPWIGTEQARTYRLDGDRLDILSPTGPMPQPGGGQKIVSGVLSFVRDNSTP